ncbi:MAG: RNA 2'-phosphotransferase [Thermoplasmatales archaeon]|nr:RNA 2'-phosphotransferase [Thermoplasmatales archaeon]
MLKECEQHGYFRGPECPQCGQEGRFLMDDRELDHVGRVLTGILRHFPERYGLTMDEHGWVSLPQIVRAISQRHRGYQWLRVHHLVAIAETDAKGRYEVRDDRIRATYAHTVDVQLDLPIVLEVGLRPSDRKKVHLSKTAEDARAAGSVRTPQPVLLEVDTRAARAAGLVIMRAGTTVFLIDSVPPEYLRRAPTAEPAA